jgi:hypothetical protein
MAEPEEVTVLWSDQILINEFGKLNNRITDVDVDVKKLKVTKSKTKTHNR